MLDKEAIRLRLAEARAWRTALDQVIGGYESLLGERADGEPSPEPRALPEIHPDTFVGKSIVEASKMYLRMAGRPARTTDEIYNALIRGGIQKASKGSLATILLRDYKDGGEVYKAGKSLWGLADWYGSPKRGRGKAKRGAAPVETTKPEEGEE